MEALRNNKWAALATGVVTGLAVAAYTVWRRKTRPVPRRQLKDDLKLLTLPGKSNKLITSQHVAAIEGLARRYYHEHMGKEAEQRQRNRCEHLQQGKRKEYFDALMEDVRFEARTFELIYRQICSAMRIPLETFRRAQRACASSKDSEYKSTFTKHVYPGKKNAYGRSEQEAGNIAKDLGMQRERKAQELAVLFSADGGRSESPEESFSCLSSLMAYDSVYLEYKLTEGQTRELLACYDVAEAASEEVVEI